MDEKDKLLIAKNQLDSLTMVLRDNKWQVYLYTALITLRYEIDRQLSLLEVEEKNGAS